MDILTAYLQRYYQAAQRRHPQILYQGDGASSQIALTFDDGPHPIDTPRLLEVLERHKVRATFHLVGKSVERHPDLARQIHQCGHQLALHCYRHIPFPLEAETALHTGLECTRNAIANATELSPASIRDLRPPYGILTARTRFQLEERGFRLVMWSCLPPHWMQPIGWSIRQVMEAAVPGAVIVLHDGHGHGRRVAEIVNAIVPQIRSLGFEFITVEKMQMQRSQTATHPDQSQVTI
jgi:peptidoglycan/xylan/chitin deacetylase (PgdA/CDA1 family)